MGSLGMYILYFIKLPFLKMTFYFGVHMGKGCGVCVCVFSTHFFQGLGLLKSYAGS